MKILLFRLYCFIENSTSQAPSLTGSCDARDAMRILAVPSLGLVAPLVDASPAAGVLEATPLEGLSTRVFTLEKDTPLVVSEDLRLGLRAEEEVVGEAVGCLGERHR